MDKLFRQVSVKDRLPENNGGIIAICSPEDGLQQLYFKDGEFLDPMDDLPMKATAWLEEVVLPKIDNVLEQRQEIYKKAGKKWGQYAQMEMAIEEALEFALAVRKQIRKSDDNTFSHMVEEFADLEIMMEQVEQMHSDSGFRDMVNAQKEFKIDRLLKRLKGEKK